MSSDADADLSWILARTWNLAVEFRNGGYGIVYDPSPQSTLVVTYSDLAGREHGTSTTFPMWLHEMSAEDKTNRVDRMLANVRVLMETSLSELRLLAKTSS